MALTVGLTGSVGAGKSEALAALGRIGAATISSDAVVHELLGEPALAERMIERFGPEVATGAVIDRARVGEIVFGDRAELAWLESQLHPLVGERIGRWISDLPAEQTLAVVEVPLLFETGMEGAFDTTIAVVAPAELRRARAEARGQELLEGRDARQLSQEEKATRAEHVIRNEGSLSELEGALSDLVAKLLGSQPPSGALDREG